MHSAGMPLLATSSKNAPFSASASSFGSTPRSASATISVAQWRSAPPKRMSGQTNRSRTSAGCAPVGSEHLAGPGARQVGAVGEEARGLLDRVVARVRGPDERRLVGNWEGVDDPEPPAVPARERRPVEVEAPAEAELGKRQELGCGAPSECGHRPDLDEARDPDHGRRPPPCDLPSRVAAERLSRLREIELEGF